MVILGIIWLLLACAVAGCAFRRGRDRTGWFALSVLVSPLVAGLLVLLLPDRATLAAEADRAPCPMCAERIPRAARLCPHCHTALPDRWDRVPADTIRRHIARRSDPSPPSNTPTPI